MSIIRINSIGKSSESFIKAKITRSDNGASGETIIPILPKSLKPLFDFEVKLVEPKDPNKKQKLIVKISPKEGTKIRTKVAILNLRYYHQNTTKLEENFDLEFVTEFPKEEIGSPESKLPPSKRSSPTVQAQASRAATQTPAAIKEATKTEAA